MERQSSSPVKRKLPINENSEDDEHSDEEKKIAASKDLDLLQDQESSEEENIQFEEESVASEDPYKLHFEFKLSKETIDNYSVIFEKQKKDNWPTLGTFYTTDFPTNQLTPAVELIKKSALQEFHLKENLLKSCQSIKLSDNIGELSSLQSEFLSVISSYRDVLFGNRTDDNGKSLRIMYCIHALNHILKAKAKIIHHNSKLSKNPNEEFRDQGFTRPLVLMLMPFREDCYQIVNMLSTLLTSNVTNRKRFEKEYGSEKPHPRKRPRPEDFEKTFAGNIDEDFKIGLKIKNRSLTLYADFYSAELIIASPLGLRQIVGGEGDKKRDFDFLSSIEILIVDRGDVLMMQNWYHVNHIFKHLNLLPKETHNCDMFRVRTYALDGLSRFYRQTIFISSVEHAWFRAVFSNNLCQNHAGCLRTCSTVISPSISKVVISVPHVFLWFESPVLQEEMNDRFNFFISKVLPQYRKDPNDPEPPVNQILIYAPFYHEFVKLRNYFRSHGLSSTMICEYTNSGKIAQSRNLFFKGLRQFMFYTERAHFYNRYHIKGVQHVIFYRLPTYARFYHEICNFLQTDLTTRITCTALFTESDSLQLKQVVGINRAIHMLNSRRAVTTI